MASWDSHGAYWLSPKHSAWKYRPSNREIFLNFWRRIVSAMVYAELYLSRRLVYVPIYCNVCHLTAGRSIADDCNIWVAWRPVDRDARNRKYLTIPVIYRDAEYRNTSLSRYFMTLKQFSLNSKNSPLYVSLPRWKHVHCTTQAIYSQGVMGFWDPSRIGRQKKSIFVQTRKQLYWIDTQGSSVSQCHHVLTFI